MEAPELPGLPLDRLEEWLVEHVAPGCGPLHATRIAGGRSNLTYVVEGAQGRWIVRRPPVGEHLATAHDVAREYRVMAALQDTPVPVPPTVALCDDPEVLGAPFSVTGFVAGATYRLRSDLTSLGPERVRAVSERLVDTLVELHRVDPAAVGLGDLGRLSGFAARQAKRWFRQLEAVDTPHLGLAARLRDGIDAALPAAGRVGLVHGDFRLDNVLVGSDDHVAAVIDWEMATIGDTISDLALMVAYQQAARVFGDLVPSAATAPAHLTEAEVVQRYRTSSDADVTDAELEPYLALADLKIAGIVAGIAFRHRQGQTSGDGVDRLGALVEPLLRAGLEHV